MTELNGTLDGIGLFPLMTFLSGLKADGRLTINDSELSGELFFVQGRVVGATFGPDNGEVALDAIGLALGSGNFAFAHLAGEPIANLNMEPAALNAHLEQLATDRERIMAGIPSLDAVPLAALEGLDEQPVALDRASLRLLLRCDGRQSVFDLSRGVGLPATLKRLAHLVELDLVRIPQPADARVATLDTRVPPAVEAPVAAIDQAVPEAAVAPPESPEARPVDPAAAAHPRRPWWQGQSSD